MHDGAVHHTGADNGKLTWTLHCERTPTTRRLLIVALVSVAMLLSPAAAVRAEIPAGGMSAASLNEAFRAYGDTGGRWNGGDSTASVTLPDGRTVWLFSDTFIGPINADGSRPELQRMIHNSMVVQDGDALTQTLTGGTADEPMSLVGAASDADPAAAGHFVADGTVEGSTLKVLYNRYNRTGAHPLDLKLTGTALATFDLPGLALQSLTPLPLADRIAWGSAIVEAGGSTYVYGASLVDRAGPVKSVYVAKVGGAGLSGAWQFWNGAGWSPRESEAARLMSGVTTAFGVQRVGDQYVLVTVEGNLDLNTEVVAYTADSPTGPFAGPIELFQAPEPKPNTEIIVYDARVHPDLARSGKLLVSYNVNSLNAAENQSDARLYRPRFVEVEWPRPTPDPATLPPAPTELTATADDKRNIALSWPGVPGATGYRVYRRDVAAGQSHLVRLPGTVTGASYTAANLDDGHLYEFSVAAVDADGTGPRSAPVSATARSGAAQQGIFQAAPEGIAVAGEYLVKLRASAAAGEHGTGNVAKRLVARYGGTVDYVFSSVLGGFSASGLTDAQARKLATDPAVEVIEEDRQATSEAGSGGVQQDPPSWGLDRIDGKLDQKFVYPSTGDRANIYVVDDGIRLSHTDFGGRAASAHSVYPNNPDSGTCGEHGTHVAGTAGGHGYGVAKQAGVFSVQIGCQRRTTAKRMAEGIDWVARNASRPAVANMSLATTIISADRDLLVNAVKDAVNDGVTVVAAAGNEDSGACKSVPAGIQEVITVAATGRDDQRMSNSNFGSCVDIFAPGAGIVSAGHSGDDQAATKTGTSMAAPHVAGAAALVLSTHPDYSPDEVAMALTGTAEAGVVRNPGVGTPNRLLRLEAPLEQAPTDLTANPADDGTIALAWKPVAAEGVHYLIKQRDVTAGQKFFTWDTPVRTGTAAVAKGLTPGHTYEFAVTASHTMATSPDSNVASGTSTIAPPPAPGNLTATAEGNGTIKLAWTHPQEDVWYWVHQRDVTLGETEFTKLSLPVTACCDMVAEYLTPGHTYEYQVSASNRGGEGPPSPPARAEAFYDAPAIPTNLRATPGDGQATLTWEPSATEGVWYFVYMRDATENEQWQKLPLPVTECCTMPAQYLTNGHEYEFRVTAVRGSESLPSNVERVTPMPPRPGTPVNLALQPLPTGEIKLTWAAPGPNLYYRVYWRDVTAGEASFRRAEFPTEQTTATWGQLTHRHVYEFKVTGENMTGEGPATAPVRATSEAARAGAPTNLRAVAAGELRINLSWDAPGPNMMYLVYWRDVTAGETSFHKAQYPTENTEATWAYLTHEHVYEFKVTATNAAGEGPASGLARATARGSLPMPPTNLRATPGDGVAKLDWTASPTSGVGYVIYSRNVSTGQSWQRNPYPVLVCCTYTVESLVNGDKYEFRVAAGNGVGESVPSTTVSATPLPALPKPPTNMRATAGDGEVKLAWTASPSPRVYYWIEYRKSGGSWTRLKYPVNSCCTFTVDYLANGTTYEFRARSTNAAGDSNPSNADTARPMPPFPQAPSNLSATAAGDGKVKLTWTASSTRNVYYLVEYRKAGGSSWTRMQYPVTTCCTYTMQYMTNGVTFEFRLRATNIAGDSSPSNVDSARPMPPPPKPPTNLRAVAGDSQVKLTWTASPTPNVMYNVYQRDATLNGWWEKLPYPTTKTSVTAKYLGNGHYYDFKVTAVNQADESGRSNIVTALPRWANGTTRYAEVTSSWLFNNYDDFSAIQTYDITGTVRGTRDGNYLRLDGGWHTNNGKRLLSGIFWYNIFDCVEGYSVKHGTLGYETGTSAGVGSVTLTYRMNPQRTYRVRVHGQGDITFDGNMIYGRYALRPPAGIKPFIAETPCF